MAKIKTLLQIENHEIPAHIYIEKRRSMRVAMGRDTVNIRLPNDLKPEALANELDRAKTWLAKIFGDKPYLLISYVAARYNRSIITVMDSNYSISIEKGDRENGAISLKQRDLIVEIPNDLSIFDESQLIKKLLSKMLSGIYLPEVQEEVRELNEMTFNQHYKAVRLKYNKSNWGSCSSKSNINLSSRLLLAPKEVRRYVIIHELAHLIEMNHSPKYWSLVNKVCPDYKVYERWLKAEGPNLDF